MTVQTGLFGTKESFIHRDGAYTTINGPVGSLGAPPPGMGSMAVVSVAQNKLVQAIAVETGGRPRVNDLIMHAFIGPSGTRHGSELTGEQVADFVVDLATRSTVNAETVHCTAPNTARGPERPHHRNHVATHPPSAPAMPPRRRP